MQNHEGEAYSQCLVTTHYDVFRRIPVARTLIGIIHGYQSD